MKKFIYLITAIIVAFGIYSCKCTSEVEPVVENAELVVENVVSVDKEYMFLNYNGDYKWYETCIVLKDYLDEDNDGTVNGVSNIFQVQREVGAGMDVNVVMLTHVGDTTDIQIAHTFWVEDFPLNNEDIKVTFKEAYDTIMQVNLPKPHSRQIVLRKEVGPIVANPQYIFGNQSAQIYVDATTGEVRNYNPVFPKDAQLEYTFTW